jgi:hypothetical protein
VSELRQTLRGTSTREGKEDTRSGGRTGSLSLWDRVTPRPDARTFAELLIDRTISGREKSIFERHLRDSPRRAANGMCANVRAHLVASMTGNQM